jgi:hypothetical protein
MTMISSCASPQHVRLRIDLKRQIWANIFYHGLPTNFFLAGWLFPSARTQSAIGNSDVLEPL